MTPILHRASCDGLTVAVVVGNQSLRVKAWLNGRLAYNCGPYRPGACVTGRKRYLSDAVAFLTEWTHRAGRPYPEDPEVDDAREAFTAHGLDNLREIKRLCAWLAFDLDE